MVAVAVRVGNGVSASGGIKVADTVGSAVSTLPDCAQALNAKHEPRM